MQSDGWHYTDGGDHFTMYSYIKLSYYTPSKSHVVQPKCIQFLSVIPQSSWKEKTKTKTGP